MTTYRLEYTKRPWTVNGERSRNHWRRAELVDEWRKAFCLLARAERIPALSAITVIAEPYVANRRSMPDTAACVGAVKAAVDGLIDAGVLADDGPTIVRSITFHAPQTRGYDSLVLFVSPCAEGAAA